MKIYTNYTKFKTSFKNDSIETTMATPVTKINFNLEEDYLYDENNKGLNNFDVIYFINLNHRKDRLNHILEELNKMNVDKNKIIRIEGVNKPNFGSLGCSYSHILTIEEFIKNDKFQNCIILEDDFTFNLPKQKVDKIINLFFNHIKEWDILSLASNVKSMKDTEYNIFKRLFDGQTTSGYCLNKKFAQTFLQNLKEGASFLESVGRPCYHFSIDIYMKCLQPVSNWYISNPIIGKQLEGYSDIEKKVVNYQC